MRCGTISATTRTKGTTLQQDPLGLDPETMRRLGYRTVDLLVQRLTDVADPPLRRATPAEMRARLSGPPPEQGEPFEQLLAQLERDVLPYSGRGDHPGFFAFIPGAQTWPGVLGDFIAAGANVYAGCWMESAGPSQVELEVLRWFTDWIGYPAEAAGILVSGGSAANMTALACAREALAGEMREDLVLYVSDQGHSSLARAARVLGFRRDQVRVLPSDASLRLRAETFAAAVDADTRAGRTPLLLCASGGATNAGSVDPLEELAEVCADRGVWLHVDAAYGGFAVLTERGRAALTGIERADSITLDPHKWLFQPFECGCILVRDGARLRRAFQVMPDYLEQASAKDEEVNFADRGIQLTRSARSFKVWLSIRTFGVAAFRAAIDRALDLAEFARERIEGSATLELAVSPSLGIVCFRRSFEDHEEERNAQLVEALERTGEALVSTTRLHGRFAIRMCILNHTSDEAHVERALAFLESADVGEPAEAGAGAFAHYDRHPDITRGFHEPGAGFSQPLLPALPTPERELLLECAELRTVEPGEDVVARWDMSREFYVLLDGAVHVEVDGERVATLGPGEFFGELAALDWGAGFGYPRLATVVAAQPTRLLVVPDGALPELVRRAPTLAAVIRAAVHERAARRG